MKGVVFVLLSLAVIGLCEKETADHGHNHPKDVEGEHDATYDHDAILGSKEEGKEYAELPPEEAKARLAKLIVKMDLDSDGRVSKEELTKWVHRSFIRMDVDDAHKRLLEYDLDKDDHITWAEFQQGVYSYTEEDVKELKEGNVEENKDILDMMDEDLKKFKMADVDGDNKLNKEEYSTFEHPYNYAHMQSIEVDRMLRDHDKDKDGKILWEEFQTDSTNDPDNAEYEREHFTSLDKNKDGHLNRDEVGKWVSPDNEESAREEADHLFNHADTDTNEFLTVDEILDHHDLFVGSQATDYGNYLHKHPDEL